MGKMMMLKTTRLAVQLTRIVLIGLLAAAMPSFLFADDGILEELQRCATIDDRYLAPCLLRQTWWLPETGSGDRR